MAFPVYQQTDLLVFFFFFFLRKFKISQITTAKKKAYTEQQLKVKMNITDKTSRITNVKHEKKKGKDNKSMVEKAVASFRTVLERYQSV